jgi:glutathione peroxidase
LDSNGNVYLTGEDVSIYNPSGTLIGTIKVPQTPSNVCFGKDKKILFITARKSLYSVRMLSPFYSFTLNDIDGKTVSLSQYEGKVLLVVNVASKCGFTGQYAGLQSLYEKYKDQGFVVLGFPANDFLGQEPGSNSEIKAFCSAKFNVSFPMFEKISVKGQEMHPLYRYLTNPNENGEFGKPIGWNFTKFLIGKDGRTVARFASTVEPLDAKVVTAVEKALQN